MDITLPSYLHLLLALTRLPWVCWRHGGALSLGLTLSFLFLFFPGVSLSKTSLTSKIGNCLPLYVSFPFCDFHGYCAGPCGRYFFPFLFVLVSVFFWCCRFSSGLHTRPLSAPLRGRGVCQHRTTHWAPISPMVGTGIVSTKRRGAGAGVRKGRPSTSGLLGCISARQNNLKVLELVIARGAPPRADPLDSPAQDEEVVVGTRPCWVHTF